jgi:hypothetical protein
MKYIAAFAALVFSTAASALTATPVDFSDMWWNPDESGWGANVIQQGDTIFITLFVYDASGQPTWFVGPNTAFGGSAAGAQHFTGDLFRVTGPYYGAAQFNAANVNATRVGAVTFDAPTQSTATLTYSVNGVNVTKSVQRQTWRNESLAGSYRGASIGTFTGCPGTSTIDTPTTYTIQQTASSITINEFGPSYSCRYNGTYTQTGKLGSIVGTGVCTTDGAIQNFNASNVQVGQDFFSMAFTTDVSVCHFSGRIGGVRQ